MLLCKVKVVGMWIKKREVMVRARRIRNGKEFFGSSGGYRIAWESILEREREIERERKSYDSCFHLQFRPNFLC